MLFLPRPSRIAFCLSIGSCSAWNEPVVHFSSIYDPMSASPALNIFVLFDLNR